MDQVVIVTGGSRGIGAAVALGAARRGYHVCVGFRHRGDAAADVVQACRDHGVRAVAVAVDVGVEDEVVGLFDACTRDLGPVTALVNNAGVVDRQCRVEAMSAQRVQRMLQINVVGALVCAREAVRRMSTARGGAGGAIVNVSSRAAALGAANEYVDYAASKAAVDALTIGLAKEVASEAIRVNAVRPGLIETEIHAAGGEPGRIDRLKSSIPLGRGGRPEEVAAAILWLLSAEASYVTGSLLDIGGGR